MVFNHLLSFSKPHTFNFVSRTNQLSYHTSRIISSSSIFLSSSSSSSSISYFLSNNSNNNNNDYNKMIMGKRSIMNKSKTNNNNNNRTSKLVRGDKVLITNGKDKGTSGIIRQFVFNNKNNKSNKNSNVKVFIEGKNLVKKHIKRSSAFAGGTVDKEMPIHISNVRPMDPETG